ncbi:hypothetical protein D5085_06240 [Ectothiorhodospiraceae bacterium BW-2]|nr:hypothetical protein D5085_06240 [Ectothiorhodospiraceae bacterium BW-2]
MAVLSAGGIGSGLDTQAIINALMDYERRPLRLLEQRQQEYQDQISAYGKLKSSIDSFKSAMDGLNSIESFQLFKSTLSNELDGSGNSTEGVLTVTADKNALQGSYAVSVNEIAQKHKMSVGAQYADTDTFGVGGFKITLNDASSTEIDLGDISGMTLSDVRDAINSHANNDDNLTATIINGTLGQQLILTSTETGTDAAIASVTGTSNLVADGVSTLNKSASGATIVDLADLDASITVDGVDVSSATNEFNSVIDGLDITANKIGSATLDISRDEAGVKEAVNNFVNGYNGVISKVRELRGGDLSNDSTLRTIESQLRGILNTGSTTTSGAFSHLSQMGITTNKDNGQLTLNSTTLTDAMNTNFAAVAELFGNTTDGYASRFYNLANSMLDSTDGLLASRTKGLNSSVDRLQDRQLDMEYRLALVQKRFENQFNALDGLMSQMNSTSSYLTQQLAAF